jgi:hypothetical protein
VDVSNRLRPGAATSPERLFCHVYGRGKGQALMIPGWPYPVIAALEPGRTSWTAVLDAVRLGPDDDETEVTAARVREVAERLIAAGQWHEGDPGILMVFDAGYDVMRLAFLLKDLPVEVLGRLRSDRVLCFRAPPRGPGQPGRPGRECSIGPLAAASSGSSGFCDSSAATSPVAVVGCLLTADLSSSARAELATRVGWRSTFGAAGSRTRGSAGRAAISWTAPAASHTASI